MRHFHGAQVIEGFGKAYGWERFGTDGSIPTITLTYAGKIARVIFTVDGRVKRFYAGGVNVVGANRQIVLNYLRREGELVR